MNKSKKQTKLAERIVDKSVSLLDSDSDDDFGPNDIFTDDSKENTENDKKTQPKLPDKVSRNKDENSSSSDEDKDGKNKKDKFKRIKKSMFKNT